jgi:hypothetical protein
VEISRNLEILAGAHIRCHATARQVFKSLGAAEGDKRAGEKGPGRSPRARARVTRAKEGTRR